MRSLFYLLIIIVLILSPGCTEKGREIINVYVCPDGSLASNAEDCRTEEPAVVEITRYVCSSGRIVDKASDCLTTTSPESVAQTALSEVTSSTTIAVGVVSTTLELGTTLAEETASTAGSTSTIDEDCRFVGSVNSDKYHYPDCSYAKRISEENLICFADEQEAQEMGYSPCGICRPPT